MCRSNWDFWWGWGWVIIGFDFSDDSAVVFCSGGCGGGGGGGELDSDGVAKDEDSDDAAEACDLEVAESVTAEDALASSDGG